MTEYCLFAASSPSLIFVAVESRVLPLLLLPAVSRILPSMLAVEEVVDTIFGCGYGYGY